MTEGADKILHRWLAAERRAGRAGAGLAKAEEALAALFVRLPEARPRPGFAGRVLAAAGLDLGASAAVAPAPLSWPLRALAAVCLLLTGTAVGLLRPLAVFVAGRLTLADLVSGAARALTATVDHLATLAAVGRFLAELYDALLLVVTSPPIALGWLAALVFTALTVRWLARLLATSPWEGETSEPRRSSGYVPAR